MANAATRLADYLKAIRVVPSGKKTADHREAAGGDEALRQAIKDWCEVVGALDRLERNGVDTTPWKVTVPKWTEMLFSAASWDSGITLVRQTGTEQTILILQTLGRHLDTALWFGASDTQAVEAALVAVAGVEAFLNRETGLQPAMRAQMLYLLEEIKNLLRDGPTVDGAAVTMKAATLLGLMTMVAEMAGNDGPRWRKAARDFTISFFAGTVTNGLFLLGPAVAAMITN